MRPSVLDLTRILRRSQSGNVAIIAALGMPMLVGFCGLGIDIAYWFQGSRQLHAAADIAAYDASVSLNEGGSGSTLTAAATTGATTNGWNSASGTITVNNPPTSGTHKNSKSVEVILTENMPRYFTALFSTSTVPIQARAVVTTQGEHDACVLALNPSAADAITVSGAATLNASNCDVVSNSTSSSGILIKGSGSVTTPCLVSAGGVSVQGAGKYTVNNCTTATTNATPAADPYAGVAEPTHSGACITYTNQTTLSPGYYCNGLSIGSVANVTLQPGTYWLGGGFSVGNSAKVTGSGVTIFVTSGYNVSIGGAATVTLSAPTSGTYSGIAFFGDRSGGGTNTIGNSAAGNITGVLYFPSQAIDYSGATSNNSSCTELIAYTIDIAASAGFNNGCSGDGVSNIEVADGGQGSIQLVE
jgi:Flp pilus assembly protein TadG